MASVKAIGLSAAASMLLQTSFKVQIRSLHGKHSESADRVYDLVEQEDAEAPTAPAADSVPLAEGLSKSGAAVAANTAVFMQANKTPEKTPQRSFRS